MARRSAFVVSVAALCAWLLSAGSAQAQSDQFWCSAHPSLATCVVSASIDGTPITLSDPNYDVLALPTTVGGAHKVLWAIQAVPPAEDLSAAAGHTFSITIKTRVVPREIDGFGTSMTYTRTSLGSGKYQVVITGQPVSVTTQDGCTFPPGGPVCTKVAPGPSSVILQGEIDDYNYGYAPDLRDSFYGMDMYTNVAETSLPPSLMVVDGQNELQIELTDHHFLHDGTTVVHGDFYLRMPAAFLKAYWGIDDPSTLASDGLSASVGAGGGTLSVTVEPGNTGVQVSIAGLTFSRRKLKIKLGVVTPRAPTHVKASRTSGTTARITFRPARPRGAKVRGYSASCDGHRMKVVGRHSPATITGLKPGVAYTCRLRGRSRAGYGAASKKFTIRG